MSVLALTGLLLGHVDDLAWMKGTVRWEALLDWYGVSPEGEVVHFDAGRHRGASLERGVYLDGRRVAKTESPLVGVVAFQRFVVFGARDRLIVINPDPMVEDDRERIVDQMDTASLPGALERVGVSDADQLAVESGGAVYAADADLLGWSRVAPGTRVVWSVPSPPTVELREEILHAYRGTGLPRTRMIADIHSGRILGDFGPALMDASAVILLLLVATGIMGSGLGRRRRNGG